MTSGDRVTAEHAKNLLEKRFTGQEERKTKSKKLTVLLVDELDMLWNRFEIWTVLKWAKEPVVAESQSKIQNDALGLILLCLKNNVNFLFEGPLTCWKMQRQVLATRWK